MFALRWDTGSFFKWSSKLKQNEKFSFFKGSLWGAVKELHRLMFYKEKKNGRCSRYTFLSPGPDPLEKMWIEIKRKAFWKTRKERHEENKPRFLQKFHWMPFPQHISPYQHIISGLTLRCNLCSSWFLSLSHNTPVLHTKSPAKLSWEEMLQGGREAELHPPPSYNRSITKLKQITQKNEILKTSTPLLQVTTSC